MRTPTPLPRQLTGRVFTRAEALGLGVPDQRLRRSDIMRIGPGLFRAVDHSVYLRPEDAQQSMWSFPLDAAVPQHEQLIALAQRYRSFWFSHQTAAALHHIKLPTKLRTDAALHLSGTSASPPLSRAQNIILHRPKRVPPREIIQLNGLRVSCPERFFIELMSIASLDDLVIVGDQLIRKPRARLDVHQTPWSTKQRLGSCLEWHAQTPGAPVGRAAVRLIRVGSDSPPETALRLALLRGGLPEPELQIPLDPRDPFTHQGDMGYRDKKILLQYDGAHHFTAEQQASDERRNWAFESAGWTVIRANRVDLADGFRHVVARVRHLLHV